MAKISAVMPLSMHGEKYIEEAIRSVKAQSMQDWEFIIVHEKNLSQDTVSILKESAKTDERIVLLEVEEDKSLAEKLNLGLRQAKGEYIVRIEADCPSASERFAKQLAYMEAHHDVSLLGTAVKVLTPKGESLRKAICDPDELKASMIFGAEMNHCSIMLRKSFLDANGLEYDKAFLGEYELWVRMILAGGACANLPEVMVTYRVGFGNVDAGSRSRLQQESRLMSMRIAEFLGVKTADYSPTLFANWRNRPERHASQYPVNFLRKGYQLLMEILQGNQENKLFAQEELCKVVFRRWDWIRQSCGYEFESFSGEQRAKEYSGSPLVSVVLPLSAEAKVLSKTIDSLERQSLKDWELLLIEVSGKEDGRAEIARMYAMQDSRIHFFAMEEERSLPQAMNIGLKEARGQYIAQMDGEAVLMPDRLERQAAFLEEHNEVGAVGGWQRIVKEEGSYCLQPTTEAAKVKARLMFYYDMLPSTLMFRSSAMTAKEICYDESRENFQYELLTRLADIAEITNLSHVMEERIEPDTCPKEGGEVTAEVLKHTLGINLNESERNMLNELKLSSGNDQWKVKQRLMRLEKLLRWILSRNEEAKVYEERALLEALAGKYLRVKYGVNWEDIDFAKIESLEQAFQEEFQPPLITEYEVIRFGESKSVPRLTALMPLYNGAKYIRESLEAIQAQTFNDWEFVIVNDFGSDDGCAEIVKEYAAKDNRIVLVQVLKRNLGLAASLNLGLDLIKSEYVARVDVDDPSEPERFEKQLAFMDKNTHLSLSSVWQRTVTPQRASVMEVPSEPEELKAAMLFGCAVTHCGVILRKKDFDEHNWRYDGSFLSEDYELWTRMLMEGASIANIPEPLVCHRYGFGNISMGKGERLLQEFRSSAMRFAKFLGVQTEKYDEKLFSGWNSKPTDYARKNKAAFLREGFNLCKEIMNRSEVTGFCSAEAMKNVLLRRMDWLRQCCGVKFTENFNDAFGHIQITPRVSVVLPAFRASTYISQAIDSIQAQTFTDWELLVINDAGSDDGTAELVNMYAWNDPRIRLIQAKERLGLAESLNLGMREARGEYIARIDADDTSMPERFEKQVAYLDGHPDVGILGTWQRHYGRGEWIHKAAPEPELQRCRLLFWCDLCHSTLMLRRGIFMEHELFYDDTAQAEDFDLWTRCMDYMQIANIPEVLGDYREGTGITGGKIADLSDESGRVTARTLKRVLGLNLSLYEYRLLNAWRNPISSDRKEEDLEIVREVMKRIWCRNEEVGFFDSRCLAQVLAAKYYWLKENKDWKKCDYSHVQRLEDIFAEREDQSAAGQGFIGGLYLKASKWGRNKSKAGQLSKGEIYQRIDSELLPKIDKAVEKWTWERYQRINKDLLPKIDKAVEQWTWNRYQRTSQELMPKIDKMIEQWTWERYQRVAYASGNMTMIPYYPDTKIRVVFLFQVAAFWPAQEPLYRELSADGRFEVKLVCYDERIDSSIKVETAREYLMENGYDFTPWEEFDIDDFNPHVVFLPTAYDSNRRPAYKSKNLAFKGYRVIYIPYGIEIANTRHARHDHFEYPIAEFAWKIYTFSETMRYDYLRHIHHRTEIVAKGLPRFDALFHKERFPMHSEVVENAKGRKIVLWKVHFPKVIKEEGKVILVTPDIREYIEFAKKVESEYNNIFFVFMPHPRFYEFNDDAKVRSQIRELMEILSEADNVYIDEADDYRPSLLNADAIIVDRSAVMIEAAVVDVPLLYMANADFYEPMTDAVGPLVDSYEQGTTCQDMEEFIERFRQGIDKNREARNKAFKECIPYFDGKCSERIKEDIVKSLEQESKV